MLTKEEIKFLVESFATRYDLNRYPTKEDLRDELSRVERKMVSMFVKEIGGLKEEFKKYAKKNDSDHKKFNQRLSKAESRTIIAHELKAKN